MCLAGRRLRRRRRGLWRVVVAYFVSQVLTRTVLKGGREEGNTSKVPIHPLKLLLPDAETVFHVTNKGLSVILLAGWFVCRG